MFNEITKSIQWGEGLLELKTGKIARQADGAVMVKMGDSMVLCTVVSAKEAKPGVNFFPLTIHYKEMASAIGKIPGGFIKREGRGSDREILTCRLIDRPIRPLFPSGFFNETQVICTVLSYDPKYSADILAIIGTSAALAISGAPYQEIVAASRVGMVAGEFVLNPSFEGLKNSDLDLVVAGTDTSVMMVESEARSLPEDTMLEAVKFGHKAMQPVISLIKELEAEAGKPKMEVAEFFPESLKQDLKEKYEQGVITAFSIKSKQERTVALKKIYSHVLETYALELANNTYSEFQLQAAFDEVKSDILRHDVLTNNIRIDGRKPTDIRMIECEVGLLPKAHGSALFTRGETQGLIMATLGTSQDEQSVDSLDGEYKERFMLNYNFPPYSVNETTPLKAPGRREIGHGKLAWRAINPMLPTKDQFPYALRVVSEITESNGSSSMATVCGTSMALMDAGVPITSPVSGIAMGLIKEGSKFVVLSDILGDEDHLGDMDFKVAGSKDGITALQMDIKVTGITFEIMNQALKQAQQGRIHILQEMSKAITQSNPELSKNAPCIESFKVEKDKIRDIIGPGGKVIREICELTGAKIDITDDGNVSVSAVGRDKLEDAIARIKAIAFDPEVGDQFSGTVVKILESGAFVNYLGNRDGFVHISEISQDRIGAVSDVLKVGDVVKVKILGVDSKGRIKLTIKNSENPIETTKTPKLEKEQEPKKTEASVKKEESGSGHKRESASKWQKPSQEASGVIKERKYFN